MAYLQNYMQLLIFYFALFQCETILKREAMAYMTLTQPVILT